MGDVRKRLCGSGTGANTHRISLFSSKVDLDDFQLSIPSSAFSESINSTWVKGKCPTWNKNKPKCVKATFLIPLEMCCGQVSRLSSRDWIARPPPDNTFSSSSRKKPTLPWSSPSHWPLICILVTLTVSPTSRRRAVLSYALGTRACFTRAYAGNLRYKLKK